MSLLIFLGDCRELVFDPQRESHRCQTSQPLQLRPNVPSSIQNPENLHPFFPDSKEDRRSALKPHDAQSVHPTWNRHASLRHRLQRKTEPLNAR